MFEVDFHILNQKSTPAIYADTLANIPAAGFAGRLFVNTASPYGVYRDTGSAWVQIASNGGGGGGSTGVNGLNGTTNIGLGGTLTDFLTTIRGGNNDINFREINEFKINQTNSIDINTIFSSLIGGGKLNITSTFSNLFFGSNIANTSINITASRIFTKQTISEIGLDLFYGSLLFSLGDYNFTNKKNCIKVDDLLEKIYFTTGVSTSNTTPDLFICENSSSANRFVKLGDISNVTNGIRLELYDSISNPSLTTTFNNVYYGLSIGPSTIDLGDYNQENTFVNFKIEISNNKINSQFFDSDNITQIISGLSLDFSQLETKFGIFNFSAQPDNYLFINNRDVEFFLQRDFKLTGANIEDPTPGVVPVKALFIVVNGTKYKLNLY